MPTLRLRSTASLMRLNSGGSHDTAKFTVIVFGNGTQVNSGAAMNPKHGRCTRSSSGAIALWYSLRDHQFDCDPVERNDEYRTRDSQLRLCEPSIRARPRCV